MKQVELTKEQKLKILEIANKLFPEYVHIEFSSEPNDEQYNMLLFYTYKGGSGETWSSIHWYEFCMTQLHEKLLNSTASRFEKYEVLLIFTQSGHLVDISYEAYNKIFKPIEV